MLSGEIYVQQGVITEEQLREALSKQKELGTQQPIGDLLVQMGYLSEKDRVRCMGLMWGVEFADVSENKPDPTAVVLLSPAFAKRFKVLPLSIVNNRLQVAMVNPLDIFVIDELRMVTGYEIEPLISVEEDLVAAINAIYAKETAVSDTLKGVLNEYDGEVQLNKTDGEEELSAAQLKELGEEAPIIRLANLIINQAVTDRASDIHIEPYKDKVQVRYRIDGVLHEIMDMPKRVQAPLISRFKIMANMDIAEKRVPQDNRISAVIQGKEYDFRVSTLPLVHGEKVVLRILDKGNVMIGLNKLGFLPDTLSSLEDVCSRTYGIILITGPTGSGKSTTLYSILNKIMSSERNIITIEDPVEYEIPGINQCNVNVKAGMTFAAGLRAMLRQDPDVIMVGEMRDSETATIAMEAALTGHLVLSTLHTNDAASAATRLMDMGVEPFLIASSIIAVQAQRLVRTICTKCRESYTVPRETLLRYGFPLEEDMGTSIDKSLNLFRGAGCDHCLQTGYKGRTGIHELMIYTDEIRDRILKKEPAHVLRTLAVQNGMRTLPEDALQKILRGDTTVEEVVRVIYA
ncbi:MAG TPA: type II secretion system ATPase GspE [Fimbriimonadales bacterium]|nr:type II secretion system ATPase GspE [Fimbriimonadales bacterium]